MPDAAGMSSGIKRYYRCQISLFRVLYFIVYNSLFRLILSSCLFLYVILRHYNYCYYYHYHYHWCFSVIANLITFYLSISLSIYLSICLSVSLYIYTYIYLSIYLSLSLSIATIAVELCVPAERDRDVLRHLWIIYKPRCKTLKP